PLSLITRRNRTNSLALFFRDTVAWDWESAPQRQLVDCRDKPPHLERVPRYIPEEELARVMSGIRALVCPLQRAALLTLRWSGARRGEVRRLALDCLDRYPDGTARLRIPVGKTGRERMVPLHEEAADALQAVVEARRRGRDRAMVDERTGDRLRFLFVDHGKLLS
ncbi:tyrosine-type recombinase/integrase, partial [Pseudomonas sp. EA_15y_Pfl1_P104]